MKRSLQACLVSRKKLGPTTSTVSAPIEPVDAGMLERVCKEMNITRAQFIRGLISYALHNYEYLGGVATLISEPAKPTEKAVVDLEARIDANAKALFQVNE